MKKLIVFFLVISSVINASAQVEDLFLYTYYSPIGIQYGYADKHGKIVVVPKYGAIGKFKNGLATVITGSKDYEKRTERDNYGFIDVKGNEIVKPIYKEAKDFSDGLAAVTNDYYKASFEDAYDLGKALPTRKWGYVDVSGKLVIPMIYSSPSDFKEGLAVQQTKEFLKFGYYFMDKTGKKALPAANSSIEFYQEARDFSEGLASVKIANPKTYHKAVFIDRTGKVVIDDDYMFTGDFKNGIASVYKDRKYGFVDKTGKVVIPIEYARVDDADNGYVKVYDKDNKSALFTVSGKEIVPLGGYDEISGAFNDGLSAVKSGGKWGFIDQSGKLVIAPILNRLTKFSEGLARVDQDKKVGYIDKSGKLVIPYVLGYGADFSEGLAAFSFASADNKMGYINKTGKLILPSIYNYAEDFKNGFAKVEQDYIGFLIDRTGKGTKSKDSTQRGFNNGFISEKMGDLAEAYRAYKYVEKQGNKEAAIALKRIGIAGEKAYIDKLLKTGVENSQKKDYAKALYDFQELEKINNKEGIYYLAQLHAYGLGVPKNFNTAFILMERAAKLGNMDATADLAVFYINGAGTTKDLVKAKEYTLLAANNGNAKAMFNMGSMYFSGVGVEKNLQEAKLWLLKSSKLNYQPAIDALKNNAAAFN